MITREQMRHDALVFCAIGVAGLVATPLTHPSRISPVVFVFAVASLALGARVIALLRSAVRATPTAPEPTPEPIPFVRPTLRLVTNDPPDAA